MSMSMSKSMSMSMSKSMSMSMSMSKLRFKGLYLYTSGVLFRVEWCISLTASCDFLQLNSIILLSSPISTILISTLLFFKHKTYLYLYLYHIPYTPFVIKVIQAVVQDVAQNYRLDPYKLATDAGPDGMGELTLNISISLYLNIAISLYRYITISLYC